MQSSEIHCWAKLMKSITRFICVFFLVAAGEDAANTQQPKKDQPKDRYELRQIHDPNGTGKFYMGREIAYVMGWQGAGWLERPEREREENVTKMIESLDIKEGQIVADFGAGTGHHTVKLAKLVGDKGKVYAVDVQKEMIAMLDKRLKNEKITNVKTIHNTEKDPKLPAGEVDMIMMADVYHELSYPYEVTLELVKALKPGGRLVFVEFRLEDPKVPILTVHRMSQAQVKLEMKPHAQIKHQKTLDHLPWQHVIIFEKIEEKKKDEEKAKKSGAKK
jgi:ubiquinone/menaquinone biosynthesis C-methylase UbiE